MLEKIYRFVIGLAAILFSVIFLYGFARIFVCDRFIVKGESMLPTYVTGEPVYVNKLAFGARIYRNFDFSRSDISSFRLPGVRKIRVGDVVMMNYPYAHCNDSINFMINYVYMKRCVGRPGDTVRIRDGYYLHPDTGEPLRYGDACEILSNTPDSLLTEMGVVVEAFQVDKRMEWTIREFGPLYVPAAGDIVKISPANFKTYRKMIHYEMGEWPQLDGDSVLLSGMELKNYEFKTDWYFFAGDNVLNSRDSRYFGLVPEEYIIGIVPD